MSLTHKLDRGCLAIGTAILLLLAAIPLAACGGTGLSGVGGALSNDRPVLAETDTDEQVLANAELVFANSVELAIDAVDSGVLVPGSETGDRVRQARLKAYSAILKARQAQELGEGKSVKELALLALAEANAFSAIVDAFTPG
ncbi:hypothetical protein B5C34_05145 [Pacificimonas flava]|uniref:Uncharacterized protein n=2 Tax=Pacificimonas TaxID=1960290 RepID=A0A219B3I4_9SPHN|nr:MULTISPECIES: hypothetical protein [Pacificimonas]MBZ6377396.1 hypothetical protein [Pacificimonas aurantium]OWV32897.1 hypothetical protein B5C34_05145 [Pacificimonas flava]